MRITPAALNYAAGAFALASGGLWWYASRVRVRYEPRTDADGWVGAAMTDGDADVLRTADRSACLNRWAAAAATIATLLAVASQMLAQVLAPGQPPA